MGIIWGLFKYQDIGRTDDPDPTTGLTSREIYLIRSSWAGIMKQATDSGVSLLTLYFKKFPKAKELFPFKDIPDEKLPQNSRFKAHCSSVIHAVAAVVDAIDSTDLLVSLLEKVGKSHIPRKVTAELFLQLKETMIELFTSIMLPSEVNAWTKALDVVFTVINGALTQE